MADIETAIENQEEIIQFIRSVDFFRGSIDEQHLERKANIVLELLKEQQTEIDRLKADNQKKGKWRVYEGVMKCCVCGDEYDDDIMQYFGDSVPAFCPSCGADMRKDGEQE